MTETFDRVILARLDGQNVATGSSFVGPAVRLPDSLSLSPQALATAASQGLQFLCKLPDGSQHPLVDVQNRVVTPA